MKVCKAMTWLLFLSIFSSGYVNAQTIPKDELIFLTPKWKEGKICGWQTPGTR